MDFMKFENIDTSILDQKWEQRLIGKQKKNIIKRIKKRKIMMITCTH